MIRTHIFCCMLGLLPVREMVAQQNDTIAIPFNFKFGEEKLALRKNYISQTKDTLQISVLKYYVSDFQIVFEDATVIKSKSAAYLMDFENPTTLKITLNGDSKKIISKIIFQVGIDSLTSISGAMPGDLDPTKGMYWAWQSGFINMKLEGKSSSCLTRKNEFQFHVGGYLNPYYALRKVVLEVKKLNPKITVDVAELFSKIKLLETNSILIPGKKAMKMADYSQQMFKTE